MAVARAVLGDPTSHRQQARLLAPEAADEPHPTVIRTPAARPISQELIRFARERVGSKAPEEVVSLDRMPLNAAGKVDRVTLQQMAEARLGARRPSD
jgi:acyl-coenzyme A synthetase/AMP-(fatty) acid ligase